MDALSEMAAFVFTVLLTGWYVSVPGYVALTLLLVSGVKLRRADSRAWRIIHAIAAKVTIAFWIWAPFTFTEGHGPVKWLDIIANDPDLPVRLFFFALTARLPFAVAAVAVGYLARTRDRWRNGHYVLAWFALGFSLLIGLSIVMGMAA